MQLLGEPTKFFFSFHFFLPEVPHPKNAKKMGEKQEENDFSCENVWHSIKFDL